MYRKLIIVGAARSGTNMLRNVLTKLGGIETWPCDEIPYIWRYGNANNLNDEFEEQMARPEVVQYIRRRFDRMATMSGARILVEKTCANVLRVQFVSKVVPDAKILYLYRDGRDVVSSAMKRWVAKFDLAYSLKKAPFVPLKEVAHYALEFARNRIKRMGSQERRLATWGPKIDGMSELAKNTSLHQVCAKQWARSVELAERDLHRLDEDVVCRIRYERFVSQPEEELNRVLDYIEYRGDGRAARHAVKEVSARSVGKGRMSLSREQLAEIEPIIVPGLARYGYSD